MTVPTVDRGLRVVVFWSIEIAGDSPSIESTSGLSICPRNWRAYADSDSTYRRWPSAYSVSNARLDFPEPDSPVMTTSLSRGIATVTSLRLCSRAPRITICSCGTNPPATACSTGTAPESSSLSEGERMFGEW